MDSLHHGRKSSANLLITLLPDSYRDLKILLLHQTNVSSNNQNTPIKLVSAQADSNIIENSSSLDSSDKSNLLLQHRSSVDSASLHISASHRSSTLSSSCQIGGSGELLGSSSSGHALHGSSSSGHMPSHSNLGYLTPKSPVLPPHQHSLPSSPRPSYVTPVFPKTPTYSGGICSSGASSGGPFDNSGAFSQHQQQSSALRTRYKSGPTHLYYTQKPSMQHQQLQLQNGNANKDGFRAKSSSFHDRRERTGGFLNIITPIQYSR